MINQHLTLNSFLTLLSIFGIISGIYMLILDQRAVPVSQPVVLPSVAPYEHFISGAGLVEAGSENIGVGTMVSGTVTKIFVKKGEIVPKGHPLFSIDDRAAAADLELKKAQLEASQASLDQSRSSLLHAQHLLSLVTHLTDQRGVTKEEIITRQDNVTIASSVVQNAKASVAAAQAQVKEAQATLDFYTTRAPLDCEIMQIKIRLGEFATAGTLETPLMLIGNVNRYHVRVDVDENDAWRFKKDQPAVVFLRGNPNYHTNLKFKYIEPYILPKRSLTGDSTERVDTRVLQVVYSYDPRAFPAYLGQQVDVYIRAGPISPDVKYGGPLPVSR